MSVQKKPEKVVPELLGRLSKAKDHALKVLTIADDQDQNHSHELISKFDDIESKLNQMTDSLSNIKNWEKTVVDQLCLLEQILDDEIFTFEDPEMESRVHDKLTLIQEDVVELESLISMVDQSVTVNLSRMPIKPRSQRFPDDDHHTVYKKWAELGVDDRISDINVIPALYASFNSLINSGSGHIKMCLLSLSVFPENTPIKKRPLIYWWIGEGFVFKTENSTAEEAGEQVLQDLLDEDFIKPTTTTNNMKSFLVYPWIRRMLIQLAQKNNFIKFNPTGSWTPCNGNRRAFLVQGGSHALNVDEGEHAQVLTVFNVDEQSLGIRSEWLSGLHKVEVLQMGRWQDSLTHYIEVKDYEELFKGLGSQKHLKYLSLRGISRIETLPRSIKKLVSLQILDLRACQNLEKLPQEVTELMNLTHLDVSECYFVDSMPKGLERLSKLQVLKGFVAGSPSGNSCVISDLVGLRHLRKLSIRVRNLGDEQLAILVNFPSALRILTISWAVVPSQIRVIGLPTSLTKLDLRYVPFEEVPEWLQPVKLHPNLEKLYIKGGKLKREEINSYNYTNVVKVPRFEHLP